jgi:hypothetical protein
MKFCYNDDNSCVMNCKHKKQIDVKWCLIWITVNKHGSHMDDCSYISLSFIQDSIFFRIVKSDDELKL